MAQKKMKELSLLKNQIEPWLQFRTELENLIDLCDLADVEHDETLEKEIVAEINLIFDKINSEEFKVSLSGTYDHRSAIFAIHSGAGGLEAQDWAQMLFRMYKKWSDQRYFNINVLNVSGADDGAIKSIVVELNGDYAFGYLKSEKGVHRLVRISPFDADHARHTSFALVEVMPEVEDDVEVSIDPSDLKIDVFKAGGAGGQGGGGAGGAGRRGHALLHGVPPRLRRRPHQVRGAARGGGLRHGMCHGRGQDWLGAG